MDWKKIENRISKWGLGKLNEILYIVVRSKHKQTVRKISNVQRPELGSQNEITGKSYMQGNKPEICLRTAYWRKNEGSFIILHV